MSGHSGTGTNIVLIGMPGAGKSTIGPLLAKKLDMDYTDLDDVIKEGQGKELRDIVLEQGFESFLRIQEQAVSSLRLENHVLATGGSVVMSPATMAHLKENGRIVYLQLDYETIEKRLAPGRRLARSSGQSLREVFGERTPLYSHYADVTVDCAGRDAEDITGEILAVI